MLKDYILRTFFLKDIEEYKRQGSIDAFKKAHEDIMETLKDDTEKRADELAEQKLSAMLSPVNFTQVVTMDKARGIVFIGGERATPEQLLNLKSESEFILASTIWQLLSETPKKLAQDQMFVSAESLVDLQKGKSMLYFLSQQKNILDLFQGYGK